MKAIKMLKCFTGLFFVMIIPMLNKANDGKPVLRNTIIISSLQPDTIPPKVKSADIADNKPAEDIIKVVPKARKQAIPIPVKVQVKPLKVIKPKIIKPIIRVLN